jgi:hypothetical protein
MLLWWPLCQRQMDPAACPERRSNAPCAQGVGLVAAAAAVLDSILVALMTYVTVTVEPTLSSADPLIVAGSIANSYFSPAFSTAKVVPVAATIVPVISYVFPAAANNGAFRVRIIAVIKQIVFEFIIGDKPVNHAKQVRCRSWCNGCRFGRDVVVLVSDRLSMPSRPAS